MEVWEMNKKATEGLASKLDLYHGNKKKENEAPAPKYGSYEEAKEAGDVTEMIGFKCSAMMSKKRSVVALSNEYASKLSILDIQKSIPVAKANAEKAKRIMDRLYEVELQKNTKLCENAGRGQHSAVLAEEITAEWGTKDSGYLEAKAEYLEAKKEYTALTNAKAIYIEDHRDLIEAEKAKREREELLSSGILEELGVSPIGG